MEIDIKPLFRAAGVPVPHPGIITLVDRMEGIEKNPYDDWNFMGLVSWREIHEEFPNIRKIAALGTGQSLDAIAMAHIFNLDSLEMTDIVKEILDPSRKNFERNVSISRRPEYRYLLGMDCHPLTQKVDLATFSPPPLMFPDGEFGDTGLDRTTLVPWSMYEKLSQGQNDPLLKWSLLPQLGFLLSSRNKLTENGRTITMYSGRMPFEPIAECYERAGLTLTVRNTMVKRQTDPEYLEKYAMYEDRFLQGDSFHFFEYDGAQRLLGRIGIKVPGLIKDIDDAELRSILEPARMSAQTAYQQHMRGKNVAHIGYALEGSLSGRRT